MPDIRLIPNTDVLYIKYYTLNWSGVNVGVLGRLHVRVGGQAEPVDEDGRGGGRLAHDGRRQHPPHPRKNPAQVPGGGGEMELAKS